MTMEPTGWTSGSATLDEMVLEMFGRMRSPDGSARQVIWTCRSKRGRPWLVGYTTARIVGGPHDGRFAVMAYKPTGKDGWDRVYFRGFAQRKTAKARAFALYNQHSVPGAR
jgi:hypothetical protein